MGTSNCSDEFKRDAVHQISVRGYPVREVVQRLGVSKHSLCKWVKLFGDPISRNLNIDNEAENRRLLAQNEYRVSLFQVLTHRPAPVCAGACRAGSDVSKRST